MLKILSIPFHVASRLQRNQAMRDLKKRMRDPEEENAILKRLWASSRKTRSNLRLHRKRHPSCIFRQKE